MVECEQQHEQGSCTSRDTPRARGGRWHQRGRWHQPCPRSEQGGNVRWCYQAALTAQARRGEEASLGAIRGVLSRANRSQILSRTKKEQTGPADM